MYAEVLLPQKVGTSKETLTYQIPAELENPRPGIIVEVPLRNSKIKGIIFKLHQEKPDYATKNINKIVENAPHLENWQIELLKWISEYYFCPLFKTLKLFLPVPFVKKKKLKEWQPEVEDNFLNQSKHQLNKDQLQVLKDLQQSNKTVTILHGITGSGKTEIYLHIADEQVHQGKQVLMLIPEISLTTQTVYRFKRHFNHKVAIIHSQLTAKEKEKAWMSIHNGEAKIIIGSRSSLFAPFKNLGYIIMDEEHDGSYKQDKSPHYNSLDVAKKIAGLLKIKVLAGSATPTLESYYQAKLGTYNLLELAERATKETSLPTATIIDLREELKKKNFSIFSELLQNKLHQKMAQKEQAILFLNRRGAASAVICRLCGYIVKCSNCNLAMTYHKKISIENSVFNAERLICHHCGKIEQVPRDCPHCKSSYIRYIGLGTQRVEDEINKMLPLARVIRADSDTIKKRDSFKEVYWAFKDHRADILIGTQMIALGLHLPKVNLVGIVLADLSLTIPNFRSSEKTFQLITQVAGRAGRECNNGEVIIQTYLPTHYAIKYAAAHDFKNFYTTELAIRKELNYPPFSRLIKLTIVDLNEKQCIQKAEKIFADLKRNNINDENQISIYPSLFPKLKNKYRWHILITGQEPAKLLKKLEDLTGISIDVDPLSTV